MAASALRPWYRTQKQHDLLGQSLNDNMIIDFSKHMNKILEIETDHVLVQPGIVKGMLDRELKKKGKFLPPDPASSNYCTYRWYDCK